MDIETGECKRSSVEDDTGRKEYGISTTNACVFNMKNPPTFLAGSLFSLGL